jgi:hypothetical protein
VVGVKMKAEGETPYEPHILIRMEAVRPQKSHEIATIVAYVEKDRTGVLMGRSFTNPTFATLCAPIMGLLGGTQAQMATEEEAAAVDAEALAAQEQGKAVTSRDTLRTLSAKLELAATLPDLKVLGKTITAKLKATMLPADVQALRAKYAEREATLKTGAPPIPATDDNNALDVAIAAHDEALVS